MGFPLYLSEHILTEFAHRLNSVLGVQVYARNAENDTPASYIYFDTLTDAHDAVATIETNVGDLYILPTAGAGTVIVRSTDVLAQLEIEYNAANEVQFLVGATGDLTITPTGGDVTITGNLSVTGGLGLGGDLDMNGNDVNEVGTITGTTAAELGIYGKRQAVAAGAAVYTPGVGPGFADTVRLSIGAGAATVVVTWTVCTHTGIVLSGTLDASSQTLDNLLLLQGASGNITLNILARRTAANADGALTVQTYSNVDVATTRLTISGGVATAIVTWAATTHTGIVLSGSLNANGQTLANLIGLYSDANTLTVYTHNAAAADTARLAISTGIDTAVATWSAVTHTGLVLSGALDASSQSLTNLLGLYSDANVLTIYTHDVGAADVARMAVSTGVATAVVTWTVCTHTGIVLSGSLDADNQTITGISRIETDSILGIAKTVALDMPIGAGGAAAAELSWELLIDAIELAGLHAETDGAGTYRYPVFMIPYLAQATGVWANPNLPTGASNGALVLLYDSVLLQTRLYSYSGGAWVSVQLA